jgi:hypothetical protein
MRIIGVDKVDFIFYIFFCFEKIAEAISPSGEMMTDTKAAKFK